MSSSTITELVAPDETLYNVIRAALASHGTGISFIDDLLPAGCLGPSEIIAIHGETASGKSTLLRNIFATYVMPLDAGGHGLPVVLIDADYTFDESTFVKLLEAKARAEGFANDAVSLKAVVAQALSKLLVWRPEEPLDLLRVLWRLRDLLAANPTTALLVVDSMSAWHPNLASFPRSSTRVLRECWQALARLQREHCLAVVVAHRDQHADNGGIGAKLWTDSACIHLRVLKEAAQGASATMELSSPPGVSAVLGFTFALSSQDSSSTFHFCFSPCGQAVSSAV